MISIAVEEARVDAARAKVEQAAVATANAVAARDSTRDVSLENARVARLAGDSLRVVEKRVVQVKQGRDALDHALGREKRAQYAVSAQVESLSVARTTSTRDGADGARTAKFHIRDAPYTVDADVALRPPPDSGTLDLRVALDTLSMRVRVACDGAGAAVVVETPRWVHARIGEVAQNPEVCASARVSSARRVGRLRLRPVLGAGRLFTATGSTWGAFLGVALTP